MNWLSRIFKAAQTRVSLIPAFMASIAWTIVDRFLVLTDEGYKRNAVAYACIRLLATSVPEARLRVYRRSTDATDDIIEEHPLQALIERPNPLMSEFDFWVMVTTQLKIVGKSIWWKERGRGGLPIALWPLRPDRVQPIYGQGSAVVTAYEYNLAGLIYQLPVNDIVLFHEPDPAAEDGGLATGLGALQVLAREIDADNAATSFVYALVSNYAVPGTLMKVKQRLTQDQANELKAKFAAKYGAMRRGEPAIIDQDADIVPLSFNLSNLEFPDLRGVSESRIASVIGVPAILVGLKVGLDRSTMANVAEMREYFAETTLSLLWRSYADRLTIMLLPDFDRSNSTFCQFDTTKVLALQKQHQERAQRYQDGLERGAVTVNEYRMLALGLPPLPGGDVLLLPKTVQAVSADGIGEIASMAEPAMQALPAPSSGDSGADNASADNQASEEPVPAMAAD